MLITTKLTDNRYWPGYSAFDTNTGIAYNIIYNMRDSMEVYLDIVSAAASGEYGSAVRYKMHDALNLWKQLAAVDPAAAKFIDYSYSDIMRELVEREEATAAEVEL